MFLSCCSLDSWIVVRSSLISFFTPVMSSVTVFSKVSNLVSRSSVRVSMDLTGVLFEFSIVKLIVADESGLWRSANETESGFVALMGGVEVSESFSFEIGVFSLGMGDVGVELSAGEGGCIIGVLSNSWGVGGTEEELTVSGNDVTTRG